MPLYQWKCRKCNRMVDVLRTFATYEQAPTGDEVGADECPHQWTREVGGNQAVVKGQGWGSGKGYW